MNETCKNRINKEFNNRMNDLKTLWDSYQKGEEDTEDLGNIFEYGLSFDYVSPGTFKNQRKGYFRYQLSWGGPSDEFRIYAHPQKIRNNWITWEVEKIEYWFLDWFDGAHKELKTGKNYQLINDIFQGLFVECESATNAYTKSMEEME
jgi:hypothetical protein